MTHFLIKKPVFGPFFNFSRAPPGEMKKSPRHEALDFPEVLEKRGVFGVIARFWGTPPLFSSFSMKMGHFIIPVIKWTIPWLCMLPICLVFVSPVRNAMGHRLKIGLKTAYIQGGKSLGIAVWNDIPVIKWTTPWLCMLPICFWCWFDIAQCNGP